MTAGKFTRKSAPSTPEKEPLQEGAAAPQGRTSKPRQHNRHSDLLDAAAHVFREKGFGQATVRDIAAASGMIAGSIYYHYASKGDLLLAVYTEGVRRVSEAVDLAIAQPNNPWMRLEAVLCAHLEMMLSTQPDSAPYASVFVQVQPGDFPPEHRDKLVALRDGYERKFRELIEALPVRRGVDKSLLRLQLIGALNHVPIWYRPDGKKSLAAIARAMTRHLRLALDSSESESVA
jgi:AcrR family transcriptional regulator